jgi:Ser/Thr protein kinase RdoA (MazF antagonist)
MSSYDLTNEQGLQEYLEAHQSAPTSVQLLSGGSANYVYRITKHDGSTRILKHAEPYLHSNKDFALDPTRMDYEARILEALSFTESPLPATLPKSNVHAVQLLSYDKTNKLLEIEDGGSRNLKDAYIDLKLDIPHIGEQLGRWLVALHVFAKNISLASSDEDRGINNNPIAVNIYRYPYNGLHTALTQFGYDPQLADLINERFGSLIATDNECICHGDFWPGNVLVRDVEQQPVDLTVVDWELVRRGTSATDVGQFAAEAFLLDRFRGGRGLLSAFLHAYVVAREHTEALGKAWLTRVVVHWAVHIAFWPTMVTWSNEEETKILVDVGVVTLENVLKEDWEKVLESPLLRDVKERYATLLVRP